MKNTALVLALAFATSTALFAQDKNQLTGPAYKNHKPWNSESKPVTLYALDKKKPLTGPAYKNKKAWEKPDAKATYTAVSFGSERSKLTGPEYKNHKPWSNNDKKNTGTATATKAKSKE